LVDEGIAVLDCDVVAREVVQPGTPGLRHLVEYFGTEILREDGQLDREKLGSLTFGTDEKTTERRRVMTAITGKQIGNVIAQRVMWHCLIGTPLLVIDAPLLYESNKLKGICSKVVVVAVSEEIQLTRLMARDASEREAAQKRIESQMSLAEKVEKADVVIWNNGSLEELQAKVKEEFAKLRGRRCCNRYCC